MDVTLIIFNPHHYVCFNFFN